MAYPKKEELLSLSRVELGAYCDRLAHSFDGNTADDPASAREALLAAAHSLAKVADDTPLERLTETGIANGVAELIAIMKAGDEERAATAIGTLAVGVLVNINRIADALEESNKLAKVEVNIEAPTGRSFIGQRER